jgi:hypothetical protein
VSGDRLTLLQRRILQALAGLTPPWTLTGGGALAGVHLGHRETRDLDLFWRSRGELGSLVSDAVGALRAGGFDVQTLRTAPDAGFSPLTLAWVLKGTDPRPALKALGWNAVQVEDLLAFRQWLIDRLAAAAAPE